MDVTDLIELLHTGWAIATKALSTPDLWIWISLVREIGISGWELLHGSSPVRWADVDCTANFSLGDPDIERESVNPVREVPYEPTRIRLDFFLFLLRSIGPGFPWPGASSEASRPNKLSGPGVRNTRTQPSSTTPAENC